MKPWFLIISIILISCGKVQQENSSGPGAREKQNISPLYTSSEIVVKVFYEPGAEPYTDKVLNTKAWDFLELNLEALLAGRVNTPTVIVPKELSEMNKILAQNRSTWNVDDVLNLSKMHQTQDSQGSSKFNIFFLNGYAKESQNIIGFHISNTNIIAIFKDVIRSGGSNNQVSKYMEQATVIHEMGHAFGLVNNGLPMATPHQDSAHGAHCKHEDCVMYYSNEGASSMVKFATTSLARNSIVMFEKQCLEDARSFRK